MSNIDLNDEERKINKRIGDNIRYLIAKHNYTLGQVEALTEISSRTIRNIMQGTVTNVSYFNHLLKLFDVSYYDLLYKDLSQENE